MQRLFITRIMPAFRQALSGVVNHAYTDVKSNIRLLY